MKRDLYLVRPNYIVATLENQNIQDMAIDTSWTTVTYLLTNPTLTSSSHIHS